MRERGYVLLAVMMFLSVISLSLLAVLSTLFQDKAILRDEVVNVQRNNVILSQLKAIEENRYRLGACTVSMASPNFFVKASDVWWRDNACEFNAGLKVVTAKGAVEAHRYIVESGVAKRAMQQVMVLKVGNVEWLSQWLVASDEAAVINAESVLSVPRREQLECLQG